MKNVFPQPNFGLRKPRCWFGMPPTFPRLATAALPPFQASRQPISRSNNFASAATKKVLRNSGVTPHTPKDPFSMEENFQSF